MTSPSSAEDWAASVASYLVEAGDKVKRGSVKVDSFDGAIPLLLSGAKAPFDPDEGMFIRPEEFHADDLPSRFDVTIMQSDGEWTQFCRARQVSPKVIRGKTEKYAGRVIRLDYGGFQGRRWYGLTRYAGWVRGAWRELVDTGSGGRTPGHRNFAVGDFTSVHRRVALMQSLDFTREWYWRARVQPENAPALELWTDATGVLSMFRDRGVPPGRKRRSALRHWVKSHWRVRRGDPDSLSAVRRHMRGATEFEWCGFRVTVTPSVADMEQIDRGRYRDIEAARGR